MGGLAAPAPCGGWESPITAGLLVAGAAAPGEVVAGALESIAALLESLGVNVLQEIVSPFGVLEAARRYRLLPSDAVIALTCREYGIGVILSFDEDFDRVPWLNRIH